MKINCTLNNLRKALAGTERVVGKQITLPILENILLETERGMLKLSATNLEIGVFIRIGAKIEREGKITVPAKLLSNFVGNLPGEETVTLTLSGQTLEIKCGSHTAKIKGMSDTEFPIIPEMKGEFLFSWAGADLRENLPKLLVSASVDNTRPELAGVNVILGEEETFLASTDSFRLTEVVIPFGIENQTGYKALREKTQSIIVPAGTFSELWRVLSPESGEVKVAIEENQIFFQAEGVRVVSRLINGKYPEYKQIMPQQFETKILVGRDELLRATRMASFFTQSKGGEVIFQIVPEKGRLTVVANSEDKGENVTEILVTGTGPNQEVVFNPRYILDGINAVATPFVKLMLNSGTAPVAIRPDDEKTGEAKQSPVLTYIIMPIRK